MGAAPSGNLGGVNWKWDFPCDEPEQVLTGVPADDPPLNGELGTLLLVGVALNGECGALCLVGVPLVTLRGGVEFTAEGRRA